MEFMTSVDSKIDRIITHIYIRSTYLGIYHKAILPCLEFILASLTILRLPYGTRDRCKATLAGSDMRSMRNISGIYFSFP